MLRQGMAVALMLLHLLSGGAAAPEDAVLPDDGGSICVNDRTGEVTAFAGAARGLCWWTDGRFMLLGSGFDFNLYDRQTQKLVDLSAELITPEIKAEANGLCRTLPGNDDSDEWLEEYYWGRLGNTLPDVDLQPSLLWDDAGGAANGELHFILRCPYWHMEDNRVWLTQKDFPLVYQLPE